MRNLFFAGSHLLPDSDDIHQRNLTPTIVLPSSASVKLVPPERSRSRLRASLFFAHLFSTSVRGGTQISVVAHKPRPPGLCVFGSTNGILSLAGGGEQCQGRQDEDWAVTVSSQALIHEMELLSDNGTALLLKQPVFSEL